MENLLAGFKAAYIVDIVCILWLVISSFRGAKKGFIGCLAGFFSTIVALILAFSLAPTLVRGLSSLFGETGSLTAKLERSFSSWTGFDKDISAEGLSSALEGVSLPSFIVKYVVNHFGSDTLPAGTTLAMVIAPVVSQFVGLIVSGTIIFIVTKIVFFILVKLLTKLVRSAPAVSAVNTLFGTVVGFLKAAVIICGILELIALIPSASVSEFFGNCFLIKYIFHENPLAKLWGIFIKF